MLFALGAAPSGVRVGGVENLVAGWQGALRARGWVVDVTFVEERPDSGAPPPIVSQDALVELARGYDVVALQQAAGLAPSLPTATLVMMHNPPWDGPAACWPPGRVLARAPPGVRHRCRCQRLLEVVGPGDHRPRRTRTGDGRPPLRPSGVPTGPRHTRHDVVYAGRLVARKGAGDLITLAEAGSLPGTLWITDFAPSSVRPAEAQALRERARAARGVRLVPAPQRPAEMAALLGAARVVAVPSYREPFGMVSIEAQACARPVVGYADAGLVETAGPAARLVAPGDLDALARAISDAATAPGRCEDGAALVRRRFSLEASTTALERALEGAITRSKEPD